MNEQLKKNIILFSVLILLAPSAIQFSHAFEDHEHITCSSKNIKHIHQKEVDCNLLHRQLQNFNTNLPSYKKVIPQQFYANPIEFNTPLASIEFVFKKKSRGPPTFIV